MTGKVITSSAFIIFIIALAFSIASMFLPFDSVISNGMCFRTPIAYCFPGEIIHTMSIFPALIVVMIIISYWLMRTRNSNINSSFGTLNIPIFILMTIVTVCHIIGTALTNNFVNKFDTNEKKEGYWLYLVSAFLFFISNVMTGFQLFLRK